MISFMYVNDWKVDAAFSMEKLPNATTLLFTVIFCMMCEDLAFYCSHNMLHTKYFYPYIHKVHHMHKTTVCIAAEHAHPVEFLLGNMLPVLVGPMILGKHNHFYATVIWSIVRLLDSTEGHSGYEIPWSPLRLVPFATSNAYHDYHHSANVGNYASWFTVWDTLFRTNKDYYKH